MIYVVCGCVAHTWHYLCKDYGLQKRRFSCFRFRSWWVNVKFLISLRVITGMSLWGFKPVYLSPLKPLWWHLMQLNQVKCFEAKEFVLSCSTVAPLHTKVWRQRSCEAAAMGKCLILGCGSSSRSPHALSEAINVSEKGVDFTGRDLLWPRVTPAPAAQEERRESRACQTLC